MSLFRCCNHCGNMKMGKVSGRCYECGMDYTDLTKGQKRAIIFGILATAVALILAIIF